MARRPLEWSWPAGFGARPPEFLVVDDDEDCLLVIEHQLNCIGVKSVTVTTASAAMDWLKRKPFDALVADLHVADGDSVEVVWWAVLNSLPTVLLTASPDEARQWLGEESITVLAKPAALEDFENLLRQSRPSTPARTGVLRWTRRA